MADEEEAADQEDVDWEGDEEEEAGSEGSRQASIGESESGPAVGKGAIREPVYS